MTQTYKVPEGTLWTRADKLLARQHPEHSRVAFQRAFDAGRVLVNGRPIKRDQELGPGEEVKFSFDKPVASKLKAVKIPLNVVFEDRNMVALNKASGMTVHPGAATGPDTLVHALLHHCKGGLSGIGGVERPGIVHRLDRETSGIIIVAKNDRTHRGLADQFAAREVEKEYVALVEGVPTLLSGGIRKPIGRNLRQRHKMTVVEPKDARGRDAHTDWQVIEVFGKTAALLRLRIHTGRTHQIRVHLKSLGHVILGDRIYGWKAEKKTPGQPTRVMLHAEHLMLKHPLTGKKLDFRAPLPADFKRQIVRLRKLRTR